MSADKEATSLSRVYSCYSTYIRIQSRNATSCILGNFILKANSATTSDTTTNTYSTRDHRGMIPSTQVIPVQRHGSSCRSFVGPALSTVCINIEGYSQAKAEIVSSFAHG